MISIQVVGEFVDSVAGKTRTPAAVAGRLIEEVVELALSSGLSAQSIMVHVADALHNQSLKATESECRTVFPSQLKGDVSELGEECADVGIVLKDLCHVAGVDLESAEREKWGKFIQKKFRVSPSGTIYAVKPHIREVVKPAGL
jgi:NTP pyrophosphatase (non-canonical NTP hydrolase)